MGDVDWTGRDNERPVHEVCVDDFYVGKYEVTQGQWETLMGNNPSSGESGRDFPVNEVSWTSATLFAEQLRSKTGANYRLPTEAEWEYAARSGGRNDKWPGTNNEADLKDYAWYSASKVFDIHPVGLKKPNDLGLHDMAGNVKEWVSDWYEENYYADSQKHNPRGPHSDVIQSWSREYKRKVHRGGCANDNASRIRTSYRDKDDIDRRHKEIGFRLAIQIASEQAGTAVIRFHPPVKPGDRVRIKYPEGKHACIVNEIRSSGLIVQRDPKTIGHANEAPAPQFIPYLIVDKLERSNPGSPGPGTTIGIGTGAALGTIAGAIIGASISGLPPPIAEYALIGAGLGTWLGAIVGVNIPGGQWEQVQYIQLCTVDKQPHNCGQTVETPPLQSDKDEVP